MPSQLLRASLAALRSSDGYDPDNQTTRVERIFLGTGDPRPTGREFPWWGQGKAKGQLEMFGVL